MVADGDCTRNMADDDDANQRIQPAKRKVPEWSQDGVVADDPVVSRARAYEQLRQMAERLKAEVATGAEAVNAACADANRLVDAAKAELQSTHPASLRGLSILLCHIAELTDDADVRQTVKVILDALNDARLAAAWRGFDRLGPSSPIATNAPPEEAWLRGLARARRGAAGR